MPKQKWDVIDCNLEHYAITTPDGRSAIDLEAIGRDLVLGFKMAIGYGVLSERDAYIECHKMIDEMWPTLKAKVKFNKDHLQ